MELGQKLIRYPTSPAGGSATGAGG